jgi:sec-independent protein translocase protein TatA
MFGMQGGPEIILIIIVVILLFGSTKLPALARSLGRSMNEFKRGKEEVAREIREGAEEVKKEAEEAAEVIKES